MAAQNGTPADDADAADGRKICGIVMPIAAIGDDYSEEHWRRVRKIIQRAIERAQLKAQLVWDSPEIDVIQSAILKNLYENDVVVCDVSGLNPNVMLEAGLRLSTKKPTIIITDKIHKPPFDISTIGYIEYQRDLEYNAIEDFIENLSKKIIAVSSAAEDGTYKSFVENFKFQTVTPEIVSIPAEEYLRAQISSIYESIKRLEKKSPPAYAMAPPGSGGAGTIGGGGGGSTWQVRNPSQELQTVKITEKMSDTQAREIALRLSLADDFGIPSMTLPSGGRYTVSIPVVLNSRMSIADAYSTVTRLIDSVKSEYK